MSTREMILNFNTLKLESVVSSFVPSDRLVLSSREIQQSKVF